MKSFSSLLSFISLFFILSCQDNSQQEIFRANCDNCSFVEEEFIIKNCILDSISFENQQSEKISFSNSILKNSSFTYTQFTKSKFSKTHFVNSNLTNVVFKDSKLSGVKFKNCNLTNAKFQDKDIYVFNDCYAKNEDWLENLAENWGMTVEEIQQHYQLESRKNEELGQHYFIKMLKPPFAREEILHF